LFLFWDYNENAAVNAMLVWTECFQFLEYIPNGRISGSYGNSILNNLKNCQIVLWSGCTIFHFHWQYMRIPISISPYSHQHLLLSVIFILAILVGMSWCLLVVLIYISQIVNHVKHLFTCLLAMWMNVCNLNHFGSPHRGHPQLFE
jgi:hypothetical protein